MLELLVVLFVVSSTWIVWLRPIYHAFVSKPGKEWIEYWLVISILAYSEYNIYNEISRQVAYNFVKTMTLFVLSERAVAATKPEKPPAVDKEEPEDANLDSIADQIYYLEKLDGNTKLKIIGKLLKISDPVPFQLEKKLNWVELPKTVRAFTAYKIAILISGSKFSQEKLQEFRENEISGSLIEMLKSSDPGDRDNALLAISYITENCKKMQKVLFHGHIFDYLKRFLSYKGPSSAVALRVCRLIYKNRGQAKEEFMRLNMPQEILKFFKSDEKNDVSEALQAINDLIMRDGNSVNSGLLRILANQGLYNEIQGALEVHGSDNQLKIQLKCVESLIKQLA